MNLRTLNPRETYRKGRDNIASEFYGPGLAASRSYARAVGFFRSSIYAVAWQALRTFVGNGGRMRLICSPQLAAEDIDGATRGYEARDTYEKSLQQELDSLLEDDRTRDSAKLLGALIAAGHLEIKVAILHRSGDAQTLIFHDKLGIFEDGQDFVVFKGSMNETRTGLGEDGNLESVDVSVSWDDGRDGRRAHLERKAFEDLWNDKFPGVTVHPFPVAVRQRLIQAAAGKPLAELLDTVAPHPSAPRSQRTPRAHQIEALDAWRLNGFRGIIRHATGSGKTFTALLAMSEALGDGLAVLVLVPSEVLFNQWDAEISQALPEAHVLRAGAGFAGWRNDALRLWFSGPNQRLVLATLQTAQNPEFRRALAGRTKYLLVADEVHRLGARESRETLATLAPQRRLGLSATPERAGDPEGTNAVLEFFGGIVHTYTLADAIRDGHLCRYWYSVHRIMLTSAEQDEWTEATKRIKRLAAQLHGSDRAQGARLKARLDQELIARARIVKHAAAKPRAAVEILQKDYKPGDRWIVYCDNQGQMNEVRRLLDKAQIPTLEYHSAMAGDRSQTLAYFSGIGGVVVSIKCLDEGVDIPAVTHAIVLASSKNPREFIQRRGRILRNSASKDMAYLHDVLVEPFKSEEDEPVAFLEAELARAVEFGKSAANPSSVEDLRTIAIKHRIDLARVGLEGVESEDLEET